jgi:hypothetical protein
MGTPMNLEQIGATPEEINGALAYFQDQEFRRLMSQAGMEVKTPAMRMPESLERKLQKKAEANAPSEGSIFQPLLDLFKTDSSGKTVKGVPPAPGEEGPALPKPSGAPAPVSMAPTKGKAGDPASARAELARLMQQGMSKAGAILAMKASGWDVE